MSISLITLNEALEQLPKKRHSGQTHVLQIQKRIDQLRSYEIDNANISPVNESTSYDTLTFVVAIYCKSKNNCWLEWELQTPVLANTQG
jgi:hypothetical protein